MSGPRRQSLRVVLAVTGAGLVAAVLVVLANGDATPAGAGPGVAITHEGHDVEGAPPPAAGGEVAAPDAAAGESVVPPEGSGPPADGAPAPGADPANQRQTTLAEAAGRPAELQVGVAGATGAPREPNPAPEYDAPVSGCDPNYGDAGQCVPQVPPHAAHGGASQWTCPQLVVYFPAGVRVIGDDWLKLDRDGDGIACTATD